MLPPVITALPRACTVWLRESPSLGGELPENRTFTTFLSSALIHTRHRASSMIICSMMNGWVNDYDLLGLYKQANAQFSRKGFAGISFSTRITSVVFSSNPNSHSADGRGNWAFRFRKFSMRITKKKKQHPCTCVHLCAHACTYTHTCALPATLRKETSRCRSSSVKIFPLCTCKFQTQLWLTSEIL